MSKRKGKLDKELFLNMSRFVADLEKVPKSLHMTAEKFKQIGREMAMGIKGKDNG